MSSLNSQITVLLPLTCGYYGTPFYFHIVEWHRPYCVLRQFGLLQHILEKCNTELGLHKYDLRSRHDLDWMSIHYHYIQRWEARYDHFARAEVAYTFYGYNRPYMVWYRSITRFFFYSTWIFMGDSGNYNVFLFIILFFSN